MTSTDCNLMFVSTSDALLITKFLYVLYINFTFVSSVVPSPLAPNSNTLYTVEPGGCSPLLVGGGLPLCPPVGGGASGGVSVGVCAAGG